MAVKALLITLITLIVVAYTFAFHGRVQKSIQRKRIQPLASNSYGNTSSAVRGLVSGLTKILNFATGNVVGEVSSQRPRSQPRSRRLKRLSPKTLEEGIRQDFKEGYLFSGKIQSELYDEECVFTDPTLSFKGLETFEKNINSVETFLEKFLGANICVLYSVEKDKNDGSVKTRWRMIGDLKLPWRPRLDLLGQTTFTPGGTEGRIVSYFETWDEPAGNALLQILRPHYGEVTPMAQLAQELKGESKAVNVHLCEEDDRRVNI